MAISGRVPLLLVLGLVPVVLRPVMSTMWLWLLARAALRRSPTGCSPRRRPRCRSSAARSARCGWATPPTTLRGRDQRLAAPGARAACATPGSRRRAPPATGTGCGSPPATGLPLRTALQPRRRGDLRAVGRHGALARAARAGGQAAHLDVPGAVRSLPPFESRKHLPSRLARLRELDGRAAVRVRGQGTEFDSLREYVRGDDVRSIDWRAIGPHQQRRRPHLAARARPAGGAGARHLAHLGRPGRRTCRASTPRWTPPCCSPRSPPGPATGSTSSPATGGSEPGSGPPAPATSPPGCRTRWPTSSR